MKQKNECMDAHGSIYTMDRGQCEHEVYNPVQWNPYKLWTLQLFG